MTISMILAWFTVLFCVFAAFKWIARKSGNRSLNRFFHNIHIPFGVLALIAGLLHGFLAGNPRFATITAFTPAPVLFTLNWGTACFLAIILLAVSYLLRRKLRKHWMPVHRVLTILTLALLVLHLLDMGIQLPGRLLSGPEAPQTDAVQESEIISAQEPPVSQPPATPAPEETAQEASIQEEVSPVQQVEGSTAEEPAEPEPTPEPTPEEPLVTFSGAVLADGSYTGSAEGYNGVITLTVTVEGGQVTDITIDEHGDTPRYFDYAVSIVDTILGQQSLEVDAVSGATFSSTGILNAVYDALTPAVQSGELLITEIDLSGISRHGH